MNKLGNFIKQYRLEHSLSLREFAKLCNLSHTYIDKLEKGIEPRTGKVVEPTLDAIEKISSAMNLSLDSLLVSIGKIDSDANLSNCIEIDSMFKVPIIGTVRAGLGGIAEEDLLGFEYVYNNITAINDCFYLKVKGDSMEPHIAEGDLALVRRMDDIESGTLAVVVVNGDEGVIKKVIKKPGVIELHSFNPYYPVRIIKGEELQVVRIVGKVLETKRTW